MLLRGAKGKSPGRVGTLDPRFPEVREYLVQTYERVIGEWGFDGVKLDFIDCFTLGSHDPAIAVHVVPTFMSMQSASST